MKVLLADGEIDVDENILEKIPHFVCAQHFSKKQEYDLQSIYICHFSKIIRYLETGYYNTYDNIQEIYDYLQVTPKLLNVNINISEESIYPGEDKYHIRDNYVEFNGIMSRKFKIYVNGLNEYCDIDMGFGTNIRIFFEEYMFGFNDVIDKYVKNRWSDYRGYFIFYTDKNCKEIKVKLNSNNLAFFLTFSTV